ncbi:hypothetical protein AgCh_019137 [Apium graveolens]
MSGFIHEEIQRVVRVLSRRTKNNHVLIGKPGVGKITVVEGLSQRNVRGDVPSNLYDEVDEADVMVILFIKEIHLVLEGSLRRIDATILEENRKYVEQDVAAERRFQQVYVTEPSVLDTINIPQGLKDRYEGHHGVRIQERALANAAQLSSRYITGKYFSDNTINFIDEICANVQPGSQPEEIDNLESTRMQLKIELHAREKEKH